MAEKTHKTTSAMKKISSFDDEDARIDEETEQIGMHTKGNCNDNSEEEIQKIIFF